MHRNISIHPLTSKFPIFAQRFSTATALCWTCFLLRIQLVWHFGFTLSFVTAYWFALELFLLASFSDYTSSSNHERAHPEQVLIQQLPQWRLMQRNAGVLARGWKVSCTKVKASLTCRLTAGASSGEAYYWRQREGWVVCNSLLNDATDEIRNKMGYTR